MFRSRAGRPPAMQGGWLIYIKCGRCGLMSVRWQAGAQRRVLSANLWWWARHRRDLAPNATRRCPCGDAMSASWVGHTDAALPKKFNMREVKCACAALLSKDKELNPSEVMVRDLVVSASIMHVSLKTAD